MRVGIAGYGLAGRSFHAPLLKGCGFEVATVLTGNSTRARQAKEDFPLAKVVENFTDFLAQDLDLVVVATANSVHTEHALAAIAAGVPKLHRPTGGRRFRGQKRRCSCREFREDGGNPLQHPTTGLKLMVRS